MTKNWKERKRPICLERRIEFNDYEQTREFLEQAADLSEKEGVFPDMSFGRTYVSVTIYPQREEEKIDETVINYANQMDNLIEASRTVC